MRSKCDCGSCHCCTTWKGVTFSSLWTGSFFPAQYCSHTDNHSSIWPSITHRDPNAAGTLHFIRSSSVLAVNWMVKFCSPEDQGELPIDLKAGFWRLELSPGCSGQVGSRHLLHRAGGLRLLLSNPRQEGRTDPGPVEITGTACWLPWDGPA